MNSVLEKYYPDSTQTVELNHANVPSVYTSVEEEYRTLRDKVGMIDGIGYAMFLVSGEGAVDFLDNVSTKDIKYLNPGKIAECLFLNENAEAIGIGFIVNNENDFIVLIPPENAEDVEAWLKEKKTDDVKIEDLNETKALFFIEGQKSYEIIKEIFDFPVETLPLRDMVMVDYQNKKISLSRIGRSGEYGYALLADKDVIADLADTCLTKYKDMDIAFCGTEALNVCMLEVTQPVISKEYAEKGNVFELAEQWFVQYDKEEFLGYEKLMEDFGAEKNNLCVGFCAKGCKNIEKNAKIYLYDEEIGTVLYGQYSPSLEGYLGMGLVKTDYAVAGIPLTVKQGDDEVVIETLSSPFVRPVSWDEPME